MENSNRSRRFDKTKKIYGATMLTAVAISNNDKIIAAGDFYGRARLYSMNEDDDNKKLSFQLEKEQKLHSQFVRCLVFSDDDKYLLSCSGDNTIFLSDAKTLQKIKYFHGHGDCVTCVLFKSENEIVSCSYDNKIIVWDLNSGNQIASVDTGSWCFSLVLSPNKEIIVVGQGNGNIIAYESTIVNKTLKKITDLPKINKSFIDCLRFTPNGRNLVSFSSDKTINVYEVSSSNKSFNYLRTFIGHTDNGGAISPDGEIIAAASEDKTIKLWDIKTGNCVKTVTSHTSHVRQVAFSHSGNFLASVSYDKTLRITIKESVFDDQNKIDVVDADGDAEHNNNNNNNKKRRVDHVVLAMNGQN